MYINKILLKNFRNFSEIDFSFDKNLNFILGKNGSGKTSVLESIHYLAYTKSFRASNDREVIRNTADFFQIYGEFVKGYEKDNLNLNYVKSEGKRILINQQVLEKKRDIIGKYPMISLTPDNEKITKGSPNERRNFVDKILSQTDKYYFRSLLAYNRSLKQRNSLLKKKREEKNLAYDPLMESIDDLMIRDAYIIVSKREAFIKDFNGLFKQEIDKVSHFDYGCEIRVNFRSPAKDEKFHEKYHNKLKEKITKDVILGRTSYGPHLDNIDVYFDNREIKKVASQGEHKVSLIALKMAEGQYIQKMLKTPVIYLLDDLFALLDSDHCLRTIREISDDNQTIVTSTSLDHIEKEKEMLGTRDYKVIELNGNVR